MRTPPEYQALNRVLASHQLGTLDMPGTVQQLAFLVVDHEHFRELLAVCEPHLRREMFEAMSPYLRFQARPLDLYMAETARLAVAKELPLQNADGTLSAFKSAPDVRSAPIGETITWERPKAFDGRPVAYNFEAYNAPPYEPQTIDITAVPVEVGLAVQINPEGPCPILALDTGEVLVDDCRADTKAAQRAVDLHFGEVLTLTCRRCTRQEQFTGDTKHGAICNARHAGWTYNELLGNCLEICPECPAGRVN